MLLISFVLVGSCVLFRVAGECASMLLLVARTVFIVLEVSITILAP